MFYKKLFFLLLVAFLILDGQMPWIPEAHASTLSEEILITQVELRDIGLVMDQVLQGPYDSAELYFTLPPSWKLTGDEAKLHLNLTAYFSSMLIGQGATSAEGLVAGNLTVMLNGVTLQRQFLQSSGNQTIEITLPEEALIAEPLTQQHHLVIQWDASASCNFNLATSVVIHPDSKFSFSYQKAAVSLDLSEYPSPLYLQNTPFPAAVTIVVPDQPSQQEMQAAVAVAVGLGIVSQGELNLEFAPVGQLPTTLRDNTHLVMVGNVHKFETLKDKISTAAQDTDGIIQELLSPWNAERVILAVTGRTDESVLKAARAVHGGRIISTADASLAIVRQAHEQPGEMTYSEDITFDRLTMDALTFRDFGTTRKTLIFNVPAGVAIGADAYVDLAFNHSQLIDYLRSGMVLRLNGQPIGSVRLSDVTSSYNQLRIIIPPTAIRVGANHLEIQVDLVPRNICTDPRQESLWVTIFGTSSIHLPVTTQGVASQPVQALGQYPLAVADDLSASAMIVSQNSPPSWYVAVRLAYQLGALAGMGGYPEIVYAESVPPSLWSEKHLIVIGNPQQLPIMPELNPVLPLPFGAGGEPGAALSAGLKYQIDEKQSIGYLQLGQTSSGKVVYAILGNSGAGVQAAAAVLQNPQALKMLSAGNLAIVQGKRLMVENVLLGEQGMEQAATVIPEEPAVPAEQSSVAASSKPEGWILPVMVISIALIVLLLSLEIFAALEKRRV
ncbi:MAG: hypothetical protein HPY45_07270 [Anaerolineae bacterium]|nr:hypothetical protein [Anaerolineae bacterium]